MNSRECFYHKTVKFLAKEEQIEIYKQHSFKNKAFIVYNTRCKLL